VACIVDTSILIDAERGGRALERIPGEERQLLSVITASELLHGVHRAIDPAHRLRREAFVERMLGALEPIPITLDIARVHATLCARLAAAGNLIGPHDLWIAATALTHRLTVVTLNARHFERVPGLAVLAL
jgi:predicted nucleic acid-binding protein